MRPLESSLVPALALVFGALALGCSMDVDAGGKAQTNAADDDPLAVKADVVPGSLDDIHRTIVVRSCAGQPGLCHNGQFEPNLSTPALTYENLVGRPSLEHDKQLRVAPKSAKDSLVIDKLRNHGVISQMPLGAKPLPEEEIAMFEAWIGAGALRRPDAKPAPVLNNPPAQPQLGVFDQMGKRLDISGPFTVAPATTLTLRASVQDFETPDDQIPFVAFILQTPDGKSAVLNPGGGDNQTLGMATYDAASPPEGQGDVLDWRFDVNIGATIQVVGDDMVPTDVPTAGVDFSVAPLYIDAQVTQGGMIAFKFVPGLIKVQP